MLPVDGRVDGQLERLSVRGQDSCGLSAGRLWLSAEKLCSSVQSNSSAMVPRGMAFHSFMLWQSIPSLHLTRESLDLDLNTADCRQRLEGVIDTAPHKRRFQKVEMARIKRATFALTW